MDVEASWFITCPIIKLVGACCPLDAQINDGQLISKISSCVLDNGAVEKQEVPETSDGAILGCHVRNRHLTSLCYNMFILYY